MVKPKRSRKTSDKKKAKEWYAVVAPSEFDSKELGSVTTSDEALLQNRIIRVSLMDLTGRMSQANMYTTLNFRIKEIKGKTAYTELIGHQLSPGYIRTLVRRRRTVLHTIRDLPTQDERTVRLKMISVTKDRISDTMRKNIRAAIEAELAEASGKFNYYELMNEVINGKLSTRVFNRLRQITPMNRVEFRKSELHEAIAQ
jgi:ribosomal protein S3AE